NKNKGLDSLSASQSTHAWNLYKLQFSSQVPSHFSNNQAHLLSYSILRRSLCVSPLPFLCFWNEQACHQVSLLKAQKGPDHLLRHISQNHPASIQIDIHPVKPFCMHYTKLFLYLISNHQNQILPPLSCMPYPPFILFYDCCKM